MFRIRTVLVAVALVGAAGCGNREKYGGELRGVSGDEADRLNAEHNQFEQAEDPPFRAETHFAAGMLAEGQGNPAAAVTQYQRAVKLDSGHHKAMYRLGVLQAQMKQYPQAIETWRQYVKSTGDSATGYSNLGFCQELARQTKEAEASYRKGIQVDPKNRSCRVNYGLMLARLGRADEALAQLQTVLTPGEAQYNLASVYEQQGKKAEARAAYERARELGIGDAERRLGMLE